MSDYTFRADSNPINAALGLVKRIAAGEVVTQDEAKFVLDEWRANIASQEQWDAAEDIVICTDEVEIANDPIVSMGERGFFIQAWQWVPAPAAS